MCAYVCVNIGSNFRTSREKSRKEILLLALTMFVVFLISYDEYLSFSHFHFVTGYQVK